MTLHTLLSEHWHAVRLLRPRLRDGVQALHRRLRGKPWVLLFDPVTQRFHRVTPQVHEVLELLDGQRTLDAVWCIACERAAHSTGDSTDEMAVISQHELVQLLSSLHASDLLQTQVSPDADEVFERYRRQRRARLKQGWLNPLGIKLALLYPDAWFDKQAAFARRLFGWSTLAVWLLLVTPAAVLAWEHWQALTQNLSDRVLSAGNLALLWVTYPAVKAVHEWAHGMAVKAWGASVREVGLMFILFTPVPYVDATSSYRFASKWARAAVAAAGIMAELGLGALAVYVWLLAESGLVSALAFNVILIAGVSTVLVNGNPLMRYDGYFIACDLLEMPNLAQRATQYWAYLVDRYGFGARDAQPPIESRGERHWLLLYGAVSPVYRLAVTVGLIWFVAGEYLFVGVVLALVAAWTAFAMPLWRGWKHLRDSAGLARRRGLAMRRTVAAIVASAAFLGWVPLPFYSVHPAVVWLPDAAIVRSRSAAPVGQARVRSGEEVRGGQTLLVLESPALLAELQIAQAAVDQSEAQLRRSEVDAKVRAAGLRAELGARRERLVQAQRRVGDLRISAAAQGRWTPVANTELEGRYVKRGEVLGYVVDGPSRLLRSAIPQEDMDLIGTRAQSVQVRLASHAREPVQARVLRQVPGGEFDLVSPALGTSGGGEIVVDPSQQAGTRSARRVFDVELELQQPSRSSVFGDRAWVRFDLGWAPLAEQWALRLRQLFLARLNV